LHLSRAIGYRSPPSRHRWSCRTASSLRRVSRTACSQNVSMALIRGVPPQLAWIHAAAIVRRAASDPGQRGRSRPGRHPRVLVVGRGCGRDRCRGMHVRHAARVVAVRGCRPVQRSSSCSTQPSTSWSNEKDPPRAAIEPPVAHPRTGP